MNIVGVVLAVLLIIAAGAGGVYGGVRLAQWHYRMGIHGDLRGRALDRLLKIGALLNLHYMLPSVSGAGPALKLARQRSSEAIILLAELEEIVRAYGDHQVVIERIRELADTLISFSNFCDTTAIPGFNKIPALLDEELGTAHAVHRRLVQDISSL